MSKRVYLAVNLAVAAAAFLCGGWMLHTLPTPPQPLKAGWLVVAAAAALFVYASKAVRLDLILMERRLPQRRFLRVYSKTTFVTLLLPYKTGEIFRVFCYGRELKDYWCSFFSIVVDRFFDTVPLLLFVLGATLGGAGMSLITGVLLAFAVLALVFYLVFPAAYRYLNRFLMTQTASTRGLRLLALLDALRTWYDYAASLVRGRAPLLLLVSGVAWGAEYLSLWALSRAMGARFGAAEFVQYLNAAFSGGGGRLTAYYAVLGAVLLLALVGCVYLAGLVRKGEKR